MPISSRGRPQSKTRQIAPLDSAPASVNAPATNSAAPIQNGTCHQWRVSGICVSIGGGGEITSCSGV
jgi:hypothetical protein